MNYIIFDLEFNQCINSKQNKINSKCPFEIIQIGAIKLDENFNTINTLNKLIKPVIYDEINPYVQEITNITIDDLNNKKTFKEIYNELIDFFKGNKNILVVWGGSDIKELFKNIEYHNLDTSNITKKYIDIQRYASRYLGLKKGRNISLKNAVKSLKIPINDEFHDALNDAYYTAEVFKNIYNEKVETKIYNLYKNSTSNYHKPIKKGIDTNKLINQFEKMFKRKMTEDEKSIIKLAYMMGKTNQFEVEIKNAYKNNKKQ